MQTFIQTPTNNLANSLDFYTRLGFTIISKENPTLVSDGKALIEINPDRFARAGVKILKADWKDAVTELEKITHVTKLENGYLLSDPTGTWIYLVETPDKHEADLSNIPPAVPGNYMGVSLESTDVKRSVDVWELVGFVKSMGSPEQGWVALTNSDGFSISIMKPLTCPHLFFNPSFTYFNSGKNPEVIEKIRKLEIPITEEITYFNKEGIVDNIIIRDPGGFGFFIFND